MKKIPAHPSALFSKTVLTVAIAAQLYVPHNLHAQTSQAADDTSTQKPSASSKPTKKVTALKGVVVTGNSSSYSNTVSAGALGNLSSVNTPYSVTTLSAADLEKTQATTIAQALVYDAAISSGGANYTDYSNDITIRGLPLDLSNGIKVDGIPFESYGVNLPLSIMDGLQVLKGSSAFMYGFGSPGGTINYVTKKAPDSGTILSVNAGYHSANVYSEGIDYGTRFGPDGKYGIRVSYEHENGNDYSGAKLKGTHNASFAFDAKLSQKLTWSVNALYQHTNTTGQQPAGIYALDAYSDYASTTVPKALPGDARIGASSNYMRSRFFYAASSLDWAFSDNWKLDLTVASTHSEIQTQSDWLYLDSANGDYTDGPWAEHEKDSYKYAQLVLTGQFETGSLEHHLIAGLSYQDHRSTAGDNEDFESEEFTGNIYTSKVPNWTQDAGALVPSSTEVQKAIFASDTLQWGSHWMAILGLRYTDYVEHDWTPTETGTTITDPLSSVYQKHPLSPTVALMYKPTDNSTIYGSFVESLESGGVVGQTYSNAGVALAPIVSKQHEIGYKLDEHKFDASVAVFRLDRGAEYVNSDNAYVAGGRERFQGVDGSIKWYATDKLSLGASATYLQSKYLAVGSQWLDGRTVYGTAPWRTVLFGDYQLSAIPGLSVQASVRYTGKTLIANNTDTETTVHSTAYTLTNIGVSYNTLMYGKNVTFRFGVNNLFNKAYWSTASQALFIGAPREFMFNVKVDLF
ncbi:TonB-dependent siderophore receptor [Frateuria aurantia]